MNRLAMLVLVLATPAAAGAAAPALPADHVVVEATGVGEPYVAAIARTVSSARALAVEQFGFDLPDSISVLIRCAPGEPTRLWTDGQDRICLTVPSEAHLRRPAASGIFHLYGLCHEVGHLAQYRLIPRHDWMTSAAAEGWAHYLGSRLVDGVYAREGADLWPDLYDYRADGMARLKQQLAGPRRDDTVAGAGLWMDLAAAVGDKGVAPLLRAWGQVRPNPADPGPALGQALRAASPDPRVAAWWKTAEPVLVLKRPRSGFASQTVSPKDLAGRPAELALDDGTAAGKASLAGSGHAVRFEAAGDGWCVTAVAVHGSRYGGADATDEEFHVWLCDGEFQAIAQFAFPYAKFERGDPKWVLLPVPPTLVPREFIVAVAFNPTASRGVFVSHDAQGGGRSLTGLPAAPPRPSGQGDWMIRVRADQVRAARRPAAGSR